MDDPNDTNSPNNTPETSSWPEPPQSNLLDQPSSSFPPSPSPNPPTSPQVTTPEVSPFPPSSPPDNPASTPPDLTSTTPLANTPPAPEPVSERPTIHPAHLTPNLTTLPEVEIGNSAISTSDTPPPPPPDMSTRPTPVSTDTPPPPNPTLPTPPTSPIPPMTSDSPPPPLNASTSLPPDSKPSPIPTIPPTNHKRTILIVVVAIISVLLLGAAIVFTAQQLRQNPASPIANTGPEPTSALEPTSVPLPTSEPQKPPGPITTWNEYTNNDVGLTLKYPPTFQAQPTIELSNQVVFINNNSTDPLSSFNLIFTQNNTLPDFLYDQTPVHQTTLAGQNVVYTELPEGYQDGGGENTPPLLTLAIINQDHLIQLNFFGIADYTDPTIQQILSTLEFTDPLATSSATPTS